VFKWFREYYEITVIDSALLIQNQKEIEKRKKFFVSSLDSLRKYNKAPVLNFPKYKSDTLTRAEMDSIFPIVNRLEDIHYKYYCKITNAFANLSEYTNNDSLLETNKEYLIRRLNEYVEITQDYGPSFAKLFSLLDIPKNVKDLLLIKITSSDPFMFRETRAKLGDSIDEQKVINEFINIIKDSIDENNNQYTKERELTKSANKLFFIDSKKTWNAFFEVLGKKHRFYSDYFVDGEGKTLATCSFASRILLKAYNNYFYNDLEYFFKDILYLNPPPDCGDMQQYRFFYDAVAQYLSQKHKRIVKIPERWATENILTLVKLADE